MAGGQHKERHEFVYIWNRETKIVNTMRLVLTEYNYFTHIQTNLKPLKYEPLLQSLLNRSNDLLKGEYKNPLH